MLLFGSIAESDSLKQTLRFSINTTYICVMSTIKNNNRKVAEFLLRIQAVQLSPEQPFTWASGRKSPIYCDNRRILSHPEIRTSIRKIASAMIVDRFGYARCHSWSRNWWDRTWCFNCTRIKDPFHLCKSLCKIARNWPKNRR